MATLANAESRNPLAQLALMDAIDEDAIHLPSCLAPHGVVEDRLRRRVGAIVAERLNGYRTFAIALNDLRNCRDVAIDWLQETVKEIDSLGDPHVGGDCVRRIVLSTGIRLIYKPRTDDAEAIFRDELRRIDFIRPLFPDPIARQPKATWWVELLQRHFGATPLDSELEEFGFRYGCAIATAVALAYDDLHYENVLFGRDDSAVAIVDSETAWSVRLPRTDQSLRGLSAVAWLGLRTGLLPSPRIKRNRIAEISPLVKLLRQPTGLSSDLWRHAERSHFFDLSRVAARAPEWFDAIKAAVLDGIDFAARQFASAEGDMHRVRKRCTNLKPRFVYRPTLAYYEITSEAISREILLGRDYLEELWSSIFVSSARTAPQVELHQAVSRCECEALSVGNIPHFLLGSDGKLWSSNAVVATDWRSDLNDAGSHVPCVSDISGWNDLKSVWRLQIEHLKSVCLNAEIEKEDLSKPRRLPSVVSDQDLISQIVQAVLDRSFLSMSGQRIFIDISPTGADEELSPQVVGLGLYRGAAGIGLSLWSAEQSAGRQARSGVWESCFVEASRVVRNGDFAELSRDIGWSMSSGVAGVAYALSSVCVAEPEILRIKAAFDAAILRDDAFGDWEEWDYMGGMAGLLACWAAIARRCEASECRAVVERLVTHTERILSAQRILEDDGPLVEHKGIAHGLAGLVYGLGRIRQVSGCARVERLYERSVRRFNEDVSSGRYACWPNAGTWCGGATGVLRGLGRLGLITSCPPSFDEVGLAGSTGPLQHLCCGAFGKALYTMEAGAEVADHGVLRETGHEWLSIAARKRFESFDVLSGYVKAIGFFQGVAGLLYYGAGFARGDLLPSIEMAD